jgi:hypothetical protein
MYRRHGQLIVLKEVESIDLCEMRSLGAEEYYIVAAQHVFPKPRMSLN